MQMRPATIFALIFIMFILILPVFFLDLGESDEGKTPAPDDPPANALHPHKLPPEMQREVDKSRGQNRTPAPSDGGQPDNSPANMRPGNTYE